MKARIKITLKTGVLDPQGKAIQNALGSASASLASTTSGRASTSRSSCRDRRGQGPRAVERMCKELLANTVIENYAYELVQ